MQNWEERAIFMYGKMATTKSQRLADKGESIFAMHEADNTAVKCVFLREIGKEKETLRTQMSVHCLLHHQLYF